MSKKTIEEKYRANFFKSSDMESLYRFKEDPWRLKVDGHDRFVRILHEIDTRFQEGNPRNILEVGCGEGVFTRMLARRYVNTSVYAFDISKTAVERTLENPLSNMYAFKLDLGKEIISVMYPIEVIILGDVLYYLENDQEVEHAISEFDRLLAPNGIIILTEFLRTRKYSNKVAEKFEKIIDTREVVHYQQRPIDGVKDSYLTYRFIVYRRRDGISSGISS